MNLLVTTNAQGYTRRDLNEGMWYTASILNRDKLIFDLIWRIPWELPQYGNEIGTVNHRSSLHPASLNWNDVLLGVYRYVGAVSASPTV
jgi:hypothetical protein